MGQLAESNIEIFAIETLQSLGWEYVHGLAIAPDAELQERESFEQIILTQRLRKAVATLNPGILETAREQAIQKVPRDHEQKGESEIRNRKQQFFTITTNQSI
jgi:type I restriction enzyme, R subunit